MVRCRDQNAAQRPTITVATTSATPIVETATKSVGELDINAPPPSESSSPPVESSPANTEPEGEKSTILVSYEELNSIPDYKAIKRELGKESHRNLIDLCPSILRVRLFNLAWCLHHG